MNETVPFDLLGTGMSGRNLVEAGAGTGKTYTIEGIFLRLLLEKELPVDSILVVTFTEAATAELRERIRLKIQAAIRAFETGRSSDGFIDSLIKQAGDGPGSLKHLKSALAQFDEAAIHTIHGFCHRQLLDHAFESGSRFDSEFIRDQSGLLLEIVQDFWRKQAYGGDENWSAFVVDRFGTPDGMAGDLSGLLSRPVSRILPVLPGNGEQAEAGLDSAGTSVLTHFGRLSSSWGNDREGLETMLSTHKGLDHRSYARRHVSNWMAEMDDYLLHGNPFLPPGNLHRFTQATIQEKQSGKAPAPDHPVFLICSELLAAVEECHVRMRVSLIEFTTAELKDRKRKRSLMSFDDLLTDLRDALGGPGGEELAVRIRSQYRVALIDEFQDTDPVQFEIFDAIFNDDDHPLFFIGDPKQSIYSFRGADIFAYLGARQKTDHAYTLLTNWRSDRSLIQAVNAIFGFRNNPFLFSRIVFNPADGSPDSRDASLTLDGGAADPFLLWYINDGGQAVSKTEARKRTARSVAAEIARLLNLSRNNRVAVASKDDQAAGSLVPEDIAVLVRRHDEAELIQRELRQLGVPGVVNTRATIFEDPVFGEVTVLLRAVADVFSGKSVRNALATDLMGVNGEQLVRLSADENAWERTLEEFLEYRRIWLEEGFHAMMRSVIRNRRIKIRLLGQEGGERRLTNFLHALELMHEAQTDRHLAMNGLIKWAEQQMLKGARGREESEIRLETDENAVRIMTIHASKGLEFPVVFCPFSWGSGQIDRVCFHDAENRNALTLDLGSEQLEMHREKTREEMLAEEIRLFYVALTRARNRCYLVWGNINRTADSAPAWLFHNGNQPGDRLLEDLERLSRAAGGRIRVEQMPETEGEVYTGDFGEAAELQRLDFSGFESPDWKISSFTSLSSRSSRYPEQPDRDRGTDDVTPDSGSRPPDSVTNMVTLPKGAKTGNCFHKIFEELDFTDWRADKTLELVQKTMRLYGLEKRWQPVALKLIEDVLTTPLPTGNGGGTSLTLDTLQAGDRLEEMEFYFPLQAISSQRIKNLLRGFSGSQTADLLLETFDRLDFREIPGFMKGFIDLVFHHDGRYYIVDWKTNFLGFRKEDYAFERLQRYMVTHSYVLQYTIYAVALHRMLQLKIPDYRFDTCFGGIFYIFLRGVQGGSQPEYGIYHDSMNGCDSLIEAISTELGGNLGGAAWK